MMPERTFISVVMPVHNAETTVGAAIDSVLNQDFHNFLLIVVDDCSTDDTPRIIDERLHNHPHAHIIRCDRQEGYANALIRGFRYSDAVYLTCCDADDIMMPGALSSYASAIRHTDAEIIMAPYIRRRGDKRKLIRQRPDIRTLADMPVDTAHFALWNKAIKASVILHHCLPFPDLDRWADLGVVARAVAMTPPEKIAQTHTPVYEYFERPGVTTLARSSKEKLLSDHLAITELLLEWFSAHDLTHDNAEFLRLLKFCAKIKLARNPGRDLKKWVRTYPEVNTHILGMRHIALPYRLLFASAHMMMR